MNLKTATQLVLGSLVFALVLNLSQWVIFTFNLLPYAKFEWLFRSIGLLQIFLYALPLIIFFSILNAKQRG